MNGVDDVESIDTSSVHIGGDRRIGGGILRVNEVQTVGGFGGRVGLWTLERNGVVAATQRALQWFNRALYLRLRLTMCL